MSKIHASVNLGFSHIEPHDNQIIMIMQISHYSRICILSFEFLNYPKLIDYSNIFLLYCCLTSFSF